MIDWLIDWLNPIYHCRLRFPTVSSHLPCNDWLIKPYISLQSTFSLGESFKPELIDWFKLHITFSAILYHLTVLPIPWGPMWPILLNKRRLAHWRLVRYKCTYNRKSLLVSNVTIYFTGGYYNFDSCGKFLTVPVPVLFNYLHRLIKLCFYSRFIFLGITFFFTMLSFSFIMIFFIFHL